MGTDHKPVQMIMLKSLNLKPKWLQRMLLQLQKYNLQVKYKRGDKMFLVDTLSRAHPPEIHFCEALALSDSRIQDIRQASINDLVLTTLYQTVKTL